MFDDMENEKIIECMNTNKTIGEILKDMIPSGDEIKLLANETYQSQKYLRLSFLGTITARISNVIKKYNSEESIESLQHLKTLLEVEKMLKDMNNFN